MRVGHRRLRSALTDQIRRAERSLEPGSAALASSVRMLYESRPSFDSLRNDCEKSAETIPPPAIMPIQRASVQESRGKKYVTRP